MNAVTSKPIQPIRIKLLAYPRVVWCALFRLTCAMASLDFISTIEEDEEVEREDSDSEEEVRVT